MLTKGIGFEAKDVTEDGVIEGYGSVFGGAPDSYGDIVLPGAFADSLAGPHPPPSWAYPAGRPRRPRPSAPALRQDRRVEADLGRSPARQRPAPPRSRSLMASKRKKPYDPAAAARHKAEREANAQEVNRLMGKGARPPQRTGAGVVKSLGPSPRGPAGAHKTNANPVFSRRRARARRPDG